MYPLYGLVYLFKRPDMLFQVLGEAFHFLAVRAFGVSVGRVHASTASLTGTSVVQV